MSQSSFSRRAILSALSVAGAAAQAPAKRTSKHPGYTDTPVLPGQKWKVHDSGRPLPYRVTPGAKPGDPPSDAVVLFNGKDLSAWIEQPKRGRGKAGTPSWKVENGYFEVVPKMGDIYTKESFGDVQLHLEWSHPVDIEDAGQDKGNSGIIFQGRYEVQVLESFDNDTYADGQAGAIYGQFPPLVNPTRKPGEWQVYDIVFEAPRFDGAKLVSPPYATVILNGVVLHNRKEFIGQMAHRIHKPFEPHALEQPLLLQNHNSRVRFRNIWIRRLKGYDQS